MSVQEIDSQSGALKLSSRGPLALDATAFFLADVADGLGPFLVIYLTATKGWSSADAGAAMACLLMTTVICQPFAGAWIDRSTYKRFAIAGAALLVAISSIMLFVAQTRTSVMAFQILIGASVTIFPPALAAISLGIVGRKNLPSRAGRNEACFHAGNVVAALLAIIASYFIGSIGVFLASAGMAIATAVSVLLINERLIDHQVARGADGPGQQTEVIPIPRLLRNKQLVWFGAAVIIFHFANAAMLPLAGQKSGHSYPDQATTVMAVCIIVAQLTMVPVALTTSRFAKFHRRPVLLVGFAVLPIRGLLYTFSDSPAFLVAIQIFDGIAAGIFGVVAILIVADLTRGTGRFNFVQGAIASAIGLGAAASNFLTGLIVDTWGYDAGFLFLSSIALLAFGIVYFSYAETGDRAVGGEKTSSRSSLTLRHRWTLEDWSGSK